MEGRTHHIHVARVLRDKLEAFIAGTGGDGSKLQRILAVAETELAISANNCEANSSNTKRLKSVHEEQETIVCGHSCSEHEDLTRPNVWHKLPRELLPLIFARLPIAAIVRLQSVSKAWRESVLSFDSEFSRAVEAANHRRIANISPYDASTCPGPPGRYWVRIFDVHEKVWHLFSIQPMPCASCMVGAADGGLMCFVSVNIIGPCSMVVVNPLTMTRRNLPPFHKLGDVQPAMAQLSMDANTGHYEVVVAGYLDRDRQQLEVGVYNSETDQWTEVNSAERSYGYEFHWDDMQWDFTSYNENFIENRIGPRVCAEGKLEELFPHMPPHWRGHSVHGSHRKLMKNRLIVLHEVKRRDVDTNSVQVGAPVYCITELECNGSACVEVAAHRCDPLDEFVEEGYGFTVHAACGFCLVYMDVTPENPVENPDCGWLYDMSTKLWCDLPPLPEEDYCFDTDCDFLCEIKLSAKP